MNQDAATWGDACTTEGRFAFGGGGLLFCTGTSFRYALPSDLPAAPPAGYTTRPDWYPTLRAQFMLPAESCSPFLTHAPIAPEAVTTIVPNGAMLGDHITPIDHWYIGITPLLLEPAARQASPFIPIRAAADGTIIEVSSLGSPTSMRVTIAHSCEAISVYMVINRLSGVLSHLQDEISAGGFSTPRLVVKGGDIIGEQRDNPVDFSLHDGATWLAGFANPFAYTSGDAWKPYTVDPLPYWPEAIASEYEAKLQRVQAPRAGRIDWDKLGTASGNWFLQGTIGYSGRTIAELRDATSQLPGGAVPGKNSYAYSHLSLSPHWVQPAVWIASLGMWADPAGDFRQFAIRPVGPSPEELTSESGTVVWELTDWFVTAEGLPSAPYTEPVGYGVALSDNIKGVLAVRLNSDGTLTVEPRPDLTRAEDFTGFTANALTYAR